MICGGGDAVSGGGEGHIHGSVYGGDFGAVHACEGEEMGVSVDDCYTPAKYEYVPEIRIGRVTYMGTPCSMAYCSAASWATLAPTCVRFGAETVADAVALGAMLFCIREVRRANVM